MPYLENNSFKPVWWQPERHTQTIFPSYRKIIDAPTPKRIRIGTPDDDFLDLDCYETAVAHADEVPPVVILTHGLEGNSRRPYVVGMAKILLEHGFDVVAWNCRSCSGEMNRQFRLYSHGEIEDLKTVFDFVMRQKNYLKSALVGFSMGGNISLKFASLYAPPTLARVATFSPPLDLRDSTETLAGRSNFLYRTMFHKDAGNKIVTKAKLFPEIFDLKAFNFLKDWFDVVAAFAFVNGFRDVAEYYYEGSAMNFLDKLHIPSLCVQAKNDPMATQKCVPQSLAEKHEYFHLETVNAGGHLGFSLGRKSIFTWAELRALEFLLAIR